MEPAVKMSVDDIMSAIQSLDSAASLRLVNGQWLVSAAIWVSNGSTRILPNSRGDSPEASLRAWWKDNVEELPPGSRLYAEFGRPGFYGWDGHQFVAT